MCACVCVRACQSESESASASVSACVEGRGKEGYCALFGQVYCDKMQV